MGIVPDAVAEDAKAELRRLAGERYAPTKRGPGKPTTFTQEIADAICERLSEGESLRSICRDEHMPCRASVLNWAANVGNKPEWAGFVDQFSRAMEVSGDADHDDVNDISRQAARGEIDPAAARVAIDGLKWTAGKKRPKKYGDKLQTEHSGSVTLESLILGSIAPPEGEGKP